MSFAFLFFFQLKIKKRCSRAKVTSGLIETNRSQHQTSYHIEMSGISVNIGRLERDRSVGIYPLGHVLINKFTKRAGCDSSFETAGAFT